MVAMVYDGITKAQLNNKFFAACVHGDFESVEYLLTSSELEEHANIHFKDGLGFRMACKYGNLELVRYLLASPRLKEHADIHAYNDGGFKSACENGFMDIAKFLIFDMNIKQTDEIKRFLQDDKYDAVRAMFKAKYLNRNLESTLGCVGSGKKVKL